MKYIIPLLVALVFSSTIFASELVYQPVNPNFGGNPLNGNALLALAQAQNDTTSPSDPSYAPRTALERFAESIQSRAFSTLFNNAFNDGTGGSITTDDFTVVLENVDGVLSIIITDLNTGEVTTIVVGGISAP